MNNLTPAQQVAFDQLLPFLQGAHEAKLAVLEGYAGTGKTFLVARLLGALTGLKIAVAAPTNKAVRVLRDKLLEAGVSVADTGDAEEDWNSRSRLPKAGCTCRSIHALLGLKLTELDDGRQEAREHRQSTLRDYDVVVVDECSMLDAFLFQKIVLERGGAQILFVGDPAQLPPINGKAALSPVFDQVNFKIRLVEVVRQAADNPIIRLSIRLRQLIEAGIRATALNLADALPGLETFPKAALVAGSPETLIEWWLSQRDDEPGTDVRIIAFTNDRVQRYNRELHQKLHGTTSTRFVVGERVIVHRQCAAERQINELVFAEDRLITSDELTVIATDSQVHPLYPRLAAERLVLEGDRGAIYRVWIACDEAAWQREVSARFALFRRFKAEAERAATPEERDDLKQRAKDVSAQGWALLRAFAEIRHAYAITCHKSQGSTFDCALVDFSDLSAMPDPAQFNRALYVAATRSREYLALVVT